jgi:serine/threonine-protein kinase RsbW
MGMPRPNRRKGAGTAGGGNPSATTLGGTRGGGGDGSRTGGADIRMTGGVLRATIPSDFLAGRDVQQAIMGEVQKHNYGTETVFAIRIALEEAIVNAIKHGNRLDPAKKVFVEAKVTPKRAEIIIEDQGEGFERHHVPDPTAEENLYKCSGRGVLLIESYMDSEWTRGGRRVRMVKEIK